MAEPTEEPTVPVEPTPVVEPTPSAPKVVKVKKDTSVELRVAAELALAHYRKTHTMKTPDDFKYPGFKELYKALNS